MADPLQEILRHILDNTGAVGAGLYVPYADNPIMFALAAAGRPDFPDACLLPVVATEQLLPPDFFLTARWRVVPGALLAMRSNGTSPPREPLVIPIFRRSRPAALGDRGRHRDLPPKIRINTYLSVHGPLIS